MTTINASTMPRWRFKRLSPRILLALALLLALSLSIEAVRRDAGVAVATPPAADSSRAQAMALKTIAVPLSAAEQPAFKVLKEIPREGGRLQRTRFGQEGDYVKMVPPEGIVGEPLAALTPDKRPSRAGNPDPNSVFSWGPWSQTTSLARVDGLVENDAGQPGYVRTAIVTQPREGTAGSRPAAEGLLPPGVIPPIAGVTGGSEGAGGSGGKGDRPGWGHGDKNHSHHHKHQHQHQQHGR
jgi:hypothetical protein